NYTQNKSFQKSIYFLQLAQNTYELALQTI
ncbi:MAG: hypothetical protein ACI85I_002805, partial [Arenicella sp.]